MKVAVIIPAAGSGKRFAETADGGKNKLEMELAGKPVFMRTLELFYKRPEVDQTIVAVHPDRLDAFRLRFGDTLSFHGVQLVEGGTVERWETVSKALGAVSEDCTHVAVHDAVRPLTSDALIARIFEAAGKCDAVIPAVPVSATLKRVTEADAADEQQSDDPLDAILGSASPKIELKQVAETIDRRGVVAVQTPQVFKRELLQRAYAQITDGQVGGRPVTDDAGLIEALGEPVHVVEGETTNLKITRPEDAQIAEALLAARQQEAAASMGKKRLFADDEDDL